MFNSFFSENVAVYDKMWKYTKNPKPLCSNVTYYIRSPTYIPKKIRCTNIVYVQVYSYRRECSSNRNFNNLEPDRPLYGWIKHGHYITLCFSCNNISFKEDAGHLLKIKQL
jgi:hypothetical protein